MSTILGKYVVNNLLTKERSKASFDIKLMTYFLEGDKEKVERRKELEKKFYEDQFPSELINLPVDYLNHSEIYEEALIKASSIYKEAMQLEDPREILGIAEAFHYEASPFLLHFCMFIPALMANCNDEQQSQWLPDAIELKIVGTYAQTELGHGSYLKGLQTKAEYDRKSQTFLLNTPTLESIKWWPGGLGKTANYAIVVAQLYHDNIHRGIHPFIVQIRDLKTHKPLKGITVGEIGPKMGLKAADNGYLHLNNVIIPRNNMLMKNAAIDEQGNYYAKENKEKLNLGTMLFVRVILIDMVSYNVAKAVTIATRYSAIRKQGPNPNYNPITDSSADLEIQIIDYQAQQYKLIPWIAMSHAFKAAFISLMTLFKDVNETFDNTGDLGKTPFLHAMSSGLKALITDYGSNGIEICRKACGGHGFMLISGFPRLYCNTVAACTYEGENTILFLQTSKYLLKSINKSCSKNLDDKEIDSFIGYLYNEPPKICKNFSDNINISNLLHLFKVSAYFFVHQAFNKYQERQIIHNESPEKAWINCQNDLIKAAKVHLTYHLLLNYIDWVHIASSHDSKIYSILLKLCLFLHCYFINENSGDFLIVGLTLKDFNKIHDKLNNLMEEIRPDMVALVDAFDLHDVTLMSAIGCYDGAAYDRLFNLAKKSPLNKIDPHPAFEKYIKKITRSKL